MSETRKPRVLPVDVWLREGDLLYLMRPLGFHATNAFMIRVEADRRLTTADEVEELTAKLLAFLASPSPLPDTTETP